MNTKNYLVNIKGLIANGRINDALDELLKVVEGKVKLEKYTNEIIQISSRNNSLQEEIRMNLISRSEVNIIRNQINHSILNVIDKISEIKYDNTSIFNNQKLIIGNNNKVIQGNTENNVSININNRLVSSNTIEEFIKSQNKIKILFIASNPLDTSRLRLEKEMREIDIELSRAKYRDNFELRKYMDARLDDLLNILLEDTPNFIHFAGHGTDEGIAFMDDKTEKSHILHNESLASLLKLFSNDIACVFLNSCYSKSQGKEIIKSIPNIIGMKKEVPDKAAIVFAKSFYKSIGAGKEIDFAFNFAKVSIALHNISGEEIPEHLNWKKENNINNNLFKEKYSQSKLQEKDYENIIRKHAQEKYPTDFEMQNYVIEQQTNAYRNLQKQFPKDIPNAIFMKIRKNGKEKYPTDFEMQEYTEKQQCEAYRKLNNNRPKDIPQNIWDTIKKYSFDKYSVDFEMQEYTINQQIEAYRKLQRIEFDEVPENILKTIKSKAVEKYPIDFEMQEYIINEQVKAYQKLHKK